MKVVVSGVFLVFLAALSAFAGESRVVTLRILDGEKPQAGVKVLVTSPDGQRTCGVTVAVISQADGVVQFSTSYPRFWVSVPALNPHVVGRRFELSNDSAAQHFDLRPREWKREGAQR